VTLNRVRGLTHSTPGDGRKDTCAHRVNPNYYNYYYYYDYYCNYYYYYHYHYH